MRLLVIEDYPPLEQSLRKGLREAGFAVDSTRDGKEGLWYATGNEYDVIILDLMLPGMGGLEVLKKIRSKGCKAHVLILTAKDTVEDRVTGLDLGADDYLVKPFAFEELLARIRALLRRGYRRKNPKIKIKDLQIDLTNQKVRRGTREISLTPREYALLEYLAVRSGQTVSRTDIWEHIYEFNSSASSNVVDVYIGYLRKKVEQTGKHLSMVFGNLLENAADYTNQGGQIRIAARQADDFVEITFSNTGCKLTPNQLSKAFDSFWRADESRTEAATHAGLGLALVKRIMEALNGKVAAQIDQGETFKITLSLP